MSKDEAVFKVLSIVFKKEYSRKVDLKKEWLDLISRDYRSEWRYLQISDLCFRKLLLAIWLLVRSITGKSF